MAVTHTWEAVVKRAGSWAIIALTVLGVPTAAHAQTPPEIVEYYHLDALGSVRAVTNQSGAVVRTHDYRPFGEGENPTGGTDPTRFTGKERDTETGLDYFGARYYASRTGRLTTVDPAMDIDAALVDPQRWNRYAYALNNPLKFVDPDGRNPLLIMGAAGSAVFGGWQVYQNMRQGRPWHENVGVEAAKGLVVGATLGLAGPAIGAMSVGQLGTLSAVEASIAAAGGPAIQRALQSADAAIRFEGETGRFLAERGLLKAFDVNMGGRQIDAIAGTSRNFVIEMTTGTGQHKLAQMAQQAGATGLQVILYGRNLSAGFIREATRQGYRVATTLDELEDIVRGQ